MTQLTVGNWASEGRLITLNRVSVSGSGKREVAFGAALARLFIQAGRPTLRAASSACAAAGAPVSGQRISDWRNGRHLPKEFSTVQPLLVWLTSRAVSAGEDNVLTIPQWKDLWSADPAAADSDTDDPGKSRDVETTNRPFLGLASLTADDRAVYFGRDDLVNELAAVIRGALADESGAPRIVIVAGVSGAGKSSLLGAGIARADGVPTPRPAVIDADGLHFDDEPPADTTTTAQIVVIDQFEDVFTNSDDAVRHVIGQLEELARDGVVVVGVRADFFGHCVEFPTLARAWQRRCVIVTEMTDAQLREAITGPVKVAGGRIESGLADVLIADLHAASGVGDRAGRLPLLAHVLQVTWSRRSGNRMTISAYRASGGIARAVADTAEAAWAAVDPDDHDLARSLLMALVHVGPSGVALRTALDPATIDGRFPERVHEIIDVFAQARLLTVSQDAIMLIHDVVLTAWPRLESWIGADMENHLWRQQLDIDTAAWAGNGKHKSFLYTGSRLEMALFQRSAVGEHYRHLLTADNEAFLEAAVEQRRGNRMVRTGAIGLVVILAVISTIAAVISLRQAHDLTQQRNNAEHAALMSHIDSLRTTNPTVAARLLLAAHKLYPDDESVSERILGAASTPLATTATGHDGPIYDVAVSADGSTVATASGDRSVRLWASSDDAASYRTVATLRGFGNYVTAVSFHPTKPLLAAASGDGTVRVWDMSDPAAPKATATLRPGDGRTVYMARFSPDGTQLATSADDGSLTVYRVGTAVDPRPAAVVRAHSSAVRTLSYRPDGKVLASGGDDQVVHLWNTATPDDVTPAGPTLTGFPSITHAVAFSPDGRDLAITGDSANAQIWDVSDPSSPVARNSALPNTIGGSWSLTYSPDGARLASARSDGSVVVWNTVNPSDALPLWSLGNTPVDGTLRTFAGTFSPDGSHLFVGRDDGALDVWSIPPDVYTGQGGTISSVGASKTGQVVATAGTDAALTVWTAQDGKLADRSRIPLQRRVNDRPSVAVNAGGTQIATANNNGGLVQLWDTADRARPRLATDIATDTRYTSSVAFSPTADVLAAGASDVTVQLWDTSNPAQPRPRSAPLTGPTDLIRSIAFSPDGTRLAVGADDTHTYVYDLTSDATTPLAVIDDTSAPSQVGFTENGDILVGSRDLTAFRVDGKGQVTEVARRADVHAATLTVRPDAITVGTSTHELLTFTLAADGWHDALGIQPLLVPGETGTTFQLAPRTSSSDSILVAGDGTGSLYRQTTDIDTAKAWICTSSPPLHEDLQDSLLPHEPTDDSC